jgi:hypothetical protein
MYQRFGEWLVKRGVSHIALTKNEVLSEEELDQTVSSSQVTDKH